MSSGLGFSLLRMPRKSNIRHKALRKIKVEDGPVLFESFFQNGTQESHCTELPDRAQPTECLNIRRQRVLKRQRQKEDIPSPNSFDQSSFTVRVKKNKTKKAPKEKNRAAPAPSTCLTEIQNEKIPDFDSIEQYSLKIETDSELKIQCSEVVSSTTGSLMSGSALNIAKSRDVSSTSTSPAELTQNCQGPLLRVKSVFNALESTPNPVAYTSRLQVDHTAIVSPISDENSTSQFDGFRPEELDGNVLGALQNFGSDFGHSKSPSLIYRSQQNLSRLGRMRNEQSSCTLPSEEPRSNSACSLPSHDHCENRDQLKAASSMQSIPESRALQECNHFRDGETDQTSKQSTFTSKPAQRSTVGQSENVSFLRRLKLRNRSVAVHTTSLPFIDNTSSLLVAGCSKQLLANTVDVLLTTDTILMEEEMQNSLANLSIRDKPVMPLHQSGLVKNKTRVEFRTPSPFFDIGEEMVSLCIPDTPDDVMPDQFHDQDDNRNSVDVVRPSDTAKQTNSSFTSSSSSSQNSCNYEHETESLTSLSPLSDDATDIENARSLSITSEMSQKPTPACSNSLIMHDSTARPKPYTPQVKFLPVDRLQNGSYISDPLMNAFSPLRVGISAKRKVLEQCSQQNPISFADFIPSNLLPSIVKIGEGVYGEVFRAVEKRGSTVVFKIIPIEGDFPVNDEPQKTYAGILPEIVIAKELSLLREGALNRTPNFVEVKRVGCVYGAYPAEFLNAWNVYDEKNTSENDSPSVFGNDQLFIIFQFGDGGIDLQAVMLTKTQQSEGIIRQLAFSLAIAESELRFEHRDLHIGNVLILPTSLQFIEYVIAGKSKRVPSNGIIVFIIDFTLSRVQKENMVIYSDLASDDALFCGEGDYQFEIYRKMRTHNKNSWDAYCPYSNILWLHYMVDKMVFMKRYNGHKLTKRQANRLNGLLERLLTYKSAEKLIAKDTLFN